jgi:hypothetical protein
MISAPNLLQQLNGNRFFMLLLFAFLLSSCTVLKPSDDDKSSSKVYYPDKEKKDTVKDTIKPDTLQWIKNEKIEEVKEQPDTTKELGDKSTDFKESYKIDILIPMDSYTVVGNLEDIEQSSTNSMLHYYAGMIMALVELKEKGANLVVNVYDAPVDSDRTKDYLAIAKRDKPDLIIGPNEKEQLKKVNEFCRENAIMVVSPWKAIPNSSGNNPYYIQLKPSLETYYEKMVQDIDERFNTDEIYLIGLDDASSRSRIKNIQSIHNKNISLPNDYNTLFINQAILESENPVLKQIFSGAGKRKVIILPNWSFRDEDFLFSCLRKINLEKGTYQIEVYGMPIMLNSEKISYDLFKSLNIRIVSPNFLDDTDYLIKEFKSDFYKQFNVFPEAEAYEGFDMMSYLGSILIEHGRKFNEAIENHEIEMLTTGYKITRKNQETENANPEVNSSGYFENKKLYIIGFENNKFVKLR